MPESSHLVFRKSSYSGATTQNCVEVASYPGCAAMRDSRHPEAGHLTFPAAEWRAFIAAAATINEH